LYLTKFYDFREPTAHETEKKGTRHLRKRTPDLEL